MFILLRTILISFHQTFNNSLITEYFNQKIDIVSIPIIVIYAGVVYFET